MEPARRVFLCWSKNRSKAIAAAWGRLLPEIIKAELILSVEFQKGREWSELLRKSLDAAKTGIIFLTPENVVSPWIHFEAGALATAVGSRDGEVFTYVYELDPGQLTGPLSAYQSTVATKEDTRRLVRDLCAVMEFEPPGEQEYSRWWTKLEAALDEIPAPAITEIVPRFAELFNRKTFLEPLPDCTNQRWLDRFAAAREAHAAIWEAQALVNDLGRPGARRLYRDLIAEVDGYAMAMSGFLVQEKHYEFNGQGKLDAPAGAIKACERRRKRVNDIVAMLADPKNDTPVFEDAVEFAALEPKHRKSLIHRWEARLEANEALPVKGRWLATALRSEYDFDRIATYLYQEKKHSPASADAMAAVWREYEKLRIDKGVGSYMPLHYSLRALCASSGLKESDIESKLQTISDFLVKTAAKPVDSPLFVAIERVRKAIASRQQRPDKSSRRKPQSRRRPR